MNEQGIDGSFLQLKKYADDLAKLYKSDHEKQIELKKLSARIEKQIEIRINVETDLIHSLNLFNQLADNIRELFWVRDLETGKYLYVSPAYEKIFERSCEELMREPLSWISAVHPEDRERVLENREKETPPYSIQYRVQGEDGVTKWVAERTFPISDETDRIYRTGGIIADLTYRKQAEDLEKERKVLYRYFSDDVAEKILSEDYQERMSGENMTATIMFLDIRNFTAISESLPPHQVADMLNNFYPDIMELVLAHQGSVNKLIGDALLATFGVPIISKDDAYNAVATAVAIRKTLEMFNEAKPEHIKEHGDLRVGIGITTGPVFAGNIGSYRRMEYTVIGDVVNTASRFQNLTKKAGADILIDGNTKKAVGDRVNTRRVIIKSIRGKKNMVDAYIVKSLASDHS